MPLNVDLNQPASSDDVNINIELRLPYEQARTYEERAHDQAVNKSTMSRRTITSEETGGSQRGWSVASGSRSRSVIRGQRCDGKEGDDFDENQVSQSMPQPRPPIFSCPVCLEEITEETSTKCGHIFCKRCAFGAIFTQGKCPTCRRKLKAKDTFRIYLPRCD